MPALPLQYKLVDRYVLYVLIDLHFVNNSRLLLECCETVLQRKLT
jgi:hypothetical protein